MWENNMKIRCKSFYSLKFLLGKEFLQVCTRRNTSLSVWQTTGTPVVLHIWQEEFPCFYSNSWIKIEGWEMRIELIRWDSLQTIWYSYMQSHFARDMKTFSQIIIKLISMRELIGLGFTTRLIWDRTEAANAFWEEFPGIHRTYKIV